MEPSRTDSTTAVVQLYREDKDAKKKEKAHRASQQASSSIGSAVAIVPESWGDITYHGM